uniref:GNAT family N-acetyltransferase n=1 Tax=Thermofilum pendens TaxID=2269 RepID=A0A7C4BAB6_THEPE
MAAAPPLGVPSFEIVVTGDPVLLRQAMDVMVDAWAMPDYTEAVPAHVLKALVDNGGFVALALSEGRVVGFAMGFIGHSEEHGYYLYSHMVGVRREFRGSGVALQLKLFQREWALSNGYKLVTWTFDPCQGLNARFNFGKLGVVCRTFLENYYGEIRDSLNEGLPTDRFKVEWWITSRRVEERISGRDRSPTLDEVEHLAHIALASKPEEGLRVPAEPRFAEEELVLVEFPGDINELRRKSLGLALKWKLALRKVLSFYLARGYTVVEHVPHMEGGERRNFYLLWRASLEKVLSGEYPWR